MKEFSSQNISRHARLITGVAIAAGIIIIRLFGIQIIDEKYKINADNNAMVY